MTFPRSLQLPLLLLWGFGLLSQPASAQSQLVLSPPCAPHNSLEQNGVVVFGRLPGHPYVVAIPGEDEDKLVRVRQCVPDALILGSRWGNYIQAGAFRDRASAEQLVRVLNSQGVRGVRVVFFRD